MSKHADSPWTKALGISLQTLAASLVLPLVLFACTQSKRTAPAGPVEPPNFKGIGTYVGAYQAAQIIGERIGARGWAADHGGGGVYEAIFGAKSLSASDLAQINNQLSAINGKLDEIDGKLETLQDTMNESLRALEQILQALENVNEKLTINGAITRRGVIFDTARDGMKTWRDGYSSMARLTLDDSNKAFWDRQTYDEASELVKNGSAVKLYLTGLHSALVGDPGESDPGLLMAYARAAAYCVKTDQEALQAARFIEQQMVQGVALHFFGQTLLVDAYQTALRGDANMQSLLDYQLSISRTQVRQILDEYVRAIERLAASRVDTATVGEFNAYIGQAATPVVDSETLLPTGLLQEADRTHLALWWTAPMTPQEETEFAALKQKGALFVRVINYTGYQNPWHKAETWPKGFEVTPGLLGFRHKLTGSFRTPSHTPMLRTGIVKDRNGNAYPYQMLYARLEGVEDGTGHEYTLVGSVLSDADKTHILCLDDSLAIPTLSLGTVYGHGPKLRWRSEPMEMYPHPRDWAGTSGLERDRQFHNLSVVSMPDGVSPQVYVSHYFGGDNWHPQAKLTLLDGGTGRYIRGWNNSLPTIAPSNAILRYLGPGVDAQGKAYLAALEATGQVSILRFADASLQVREEYKVVGNNFPWGFSPGGNCAAPAVYGFTVEPTGAVTLTGWLGGVYHGRTEYDNEQSFAFWLRYVPGGTPLLGRSPHLFDWNCSRNWPWTRESALCWDPLSGGFLSSVNRGSYLGEDPRTNPPLNGKILNFFSWSSSGEPVLAEVPAWGERESIREQMMDGIHIDPAGFIYLLKQVSWSDEGNMLLLGRQYFHHRQVGSIADGVFSNFKVLSENFGKDCGLSPVRGWRGLLPLCFSEAGMSFGVDPKTKTLFVGRELFTEHGGGGWGWAPDYSELRIIATTWQIGDLSRGPM